MKIADKKIVAFDYTLTNDRGEKIDTSIGGEPLKYLHGAGNIIAGLEREIAGLEAGDEKNVIVQPADGYGVRDEKLIVKIDRNRFDTDDAIEVGMRFHAETPEGIRVMTVASVAPDAITLDGNHPLAGEVLHFQIKIISVSEATADEISHGHPHHDHECCGGGCGHHHH